MKSNLECWFLNYMTGYDVCCFFDCACEGFKGFGIYSADPETFKIREHSIYSFLQNS
jgi:hypothetical protein